MSVTAITPSNVGVMERHGTNPIITPDQVTPSHSAFRVRGVSNPGVAVVGDEIVLLLRVAEDVPAREGRVAVPVIHHIGDNVVADVMEVHLDTPGVELQGTDTLRAETVRIDGVDHRLTVSHLRVARSTDGVHFTIDDTPFLQPELDSEHFGVHDARITPMGDRYLVNYTAASRDGLATGLLETFDFTSFDRLGLIFHPDNTDVSIFPGRDGGLYRALHRPNNEIGRSSIWYAESPDLLHWGNHHCVLRPQDTRTDAAAISGGGPSIRTDKGWLQVYQATTAEHGSSFWAVLLDHHDPTRVLAQGAEPLLTPVAPCEIGTTLSTGGAVEREGQLFLYYGAGDEVTCLATTTVDAVLATLL